MSSVLSPIHYLYLNHWDKMSPFTFETLSNVCVCVFMGNICHIEPRQDVLGAPDHRCPLPAVTHDPQHICISELGSIGSGIGLSPVRCQAIILTIVRLLSIKPLGTNFNEFRIKYKARYKFMTMLWKMSFAKWRPFCPERDELTQWILAIRTVKSLI